MNNNTVTDRGEIVSMIFGLGVVILVVVVIFNFVIRNKGNVSVPGVNVVSESLSSNSYNVVKGDSLWKIAKNKYGDGNLWIKISQANSLSKPSYIEVNQQLILPVITLNQKNEADKQSVVSSDTYQVRKGDSLWKISVAVYNNGYKWVDVWNLNRVSIKNPDRIEIGMVIKLK